MDAPFSDTRLAFLALAATAAVLVAGHAVAARRSRRATWALAGVLAGAGLLLQWTLPAIPLSQFTCGPLCGSRIEVMPIAIGGAALAAAAVLSIRTRWLPRTLLVMIAFSLSAVSLLAGTRFWVA